MAAYTGRFAPSPTGPLHMGSLVAALASFLDARSQQGRWLLRIEDIDPPREQPGAIHAILHSLEAHQLHWDDAILYQSQRHAHYRDTLEQLAAQGLTYRCTCSRSIQTESIYPGHCRRPGKPVDPTQPAAIRLDTTKALTQTHSSPVEIFNDLCQGIQQHNLTLETGDFVIHRKDGLFAYQLAVVVDDIFQGITHVIRGADLRDVTARQILLFRLLASKVPAYGHIPLVMNQAGQKLSKQNQAPALDDKQPGKNIFSALQHLHQNPPAELANASPGILLAWAIANWKITAARQG